MQFTSKGPLKAHPTKMTSLWEKSNLMFGKYSNNKGSATSPIKHLDIHAPAQKWGPAPKANEAFNFLVILLSEDRVLGYDPSSHTVY